MIKVNSLSGGKTSSYMAVKYPADFEVFSVVCIDDLQAKVKDPSLLRYSQDKLSRFTDRFGEFYATAESDQTLQVMRDLEQFIGREVTWVRGESFDNVIDKGTKTRLPSWARRYCTVEMKLKPIFEWWFANFSEEIQMRIGFRFDEFKRMERFFNNNPNNWKTTISYNLNTQRHKHKEFRWRNVHFPLVMEGATKKMVSEFWQNKHTPATLFDQSRKIEFPVLSNCVGCFHKKVETLATMAKLEREKMLWFAQQEKKNKGTWLDSKKTYSEIMNNSDDLHKEAFFEWTVLGQSCDSGGCTD